MLSIFERVWSMSIIASVVILFVLVARLLLKRTPKWISYALWAVVLFRLLCPVSFQSPISLIPESVTQMNAPEVSFDIPDTKQDSDVMQEGPGYFLSAPEGVPTQKLEIPDDMFFTMPVQTLRPAVTVIPAEEKTFRFPVEWVWLAGVALLSVISGIRYGLLRRKLRCCVHVRENIYLADDIPTAFVAGLFRPKIYLPSALDEGEWSYILAHERCHIRRLDPLIRLLSFVAVRVHWFNPLVWLAFYLAGQDMEMSCDEAVVKQLGEGIRKDYSQSLLNLSAGRRFAFTPLAFGEGNTGKRIRNLSKWKKPVLWIVVIATLLCILLAVCLLTDPLREKDSDETQPTITLPRPSTNVTIPEGEFSYPFYGVSAVEWFTSYDDTRESVELPCFPGVKFRGDSGYIRAENTETGEITKICVGMPLQSCFFADLTGDGFPEICSAGFFGSGIIDSHVVIYDYANNQEYTLWDRMEYDYYLSMVDGVLWARKTPYRQWGEEREADVYGPLVLQQQGDTLVPVILQPWERLFEMTPSTSTMTGGYDGYLFVTINGSTYRYQRQTMDPQGLTADSYLGIYYENTLHNVDHRTVYRVYSTKEYTDYTVLLVEVDGVWMSYRYAPARRISEDTWQTIRNTQGLVILEDGKATLGKEYFPAFYKKTQQGEACAIQTASYYTIDPDRMVEQLYQTVAEDYPCLYLHTLSFDGQKYTISWEENGKTITKQYNFLMCYTGSPEREDAGYSVYVRYVLTNDNTVTWEDIFSGMVSSQMGAYIDHYTVYTDYLP